MTLRTATQDLARLGDCELGDEVDYRRNFVRQKSLAAKGLVFNQPNPAPFRDKLRAAGFYSEWRAKYGDEAWGLLEKSTGKLA